MHYRSEGHWRAEGDDVKIWAMFFDILPGLELCELLRAAIGDDSACCWIDRFFVGEGIPVRPGVCEVRLILSIYIENGRKRRSKDNASYLWVGASSFENCTYTVDGRGNELSLVVCCIVGKWLHTNIRSDLL